MIMEEDFLKQAKVVSDDFEDCGAFEPSRLSNRAEPARRADNADAEEETDPRPPKNVTQGFQSVPSIPNQILKYPDTVRRTKTSAEVLNLSDVSDLAKWNRLLESTGNENGPTVEILDHERKFHEGSWYVYVSYSNLQYQKL